MKQLLGRLSTISVTKPQIKVIVVVFNTQILFWPLNFRRKNFLFIFYWFSDSNERWGNGLKWLGKISLAKKNLFVWAVIGVNWGNLTYVRSCRFAPVEWIVEFRKWARNASKFQLRSATIGFGSPLLVTDNLSQRVIWVLNVGIAS